MRTAPERVYDAALRALADSWSSDPHADMARVEDAADYYRRLAVAVTDEVCAELGIHNPRPPRRQVERVDVAGGRV